MKTIFKHVLKLVVVLLLLGTTDSFAQETEKKNYDQGFRLGFGVSGGLPLQDPYNFNLGGDVRIQYDLSTRYSLTFTTGFNNFFVSGDNNDLGYIPVKGGFKAFVLKDKLYLLAEAGAAFAVTNGYNKTSLLLSPGIGYATDKIDISLRYEHYNDFPILNSNDTPGTGLGQIALRIAYGFKL
ncbi:hypothetical protein EZL74_04755 [Flavobacterium silvisoli]|uniref:Outer membrane protein beta-barrel domain-containing protein n=1 Tax=Flavobacterium silvisoli TaxID=2529433 RepID=A0A4Q9Z3Y5_9FLAO|nr:hypothetical protein [Flavobacterium silvisoli]TBX70058.1 hypothetical protein EZL74_04755 [Flavobacterium silvisoli]